MRAIRQTGLCLCIWVLIFSSGLTVPCIADRVAVIEIKYRRADEVLPMVRNMLSPDGTVTADQRTNSLIISDNEESIQKVESFLETYDKAIRQVTVHVRFDEVRSEKGGGVSADARASGKHWSVGTGGKKDDGVDVRVHGGQETARSNSEYFVRVASGSPAYILAGEKIPYTSKWMYLCRKYGHVTETVTYQNIDSGFEVVPVVMEDRVSIDIIPRISYQVPGSEPGIIRFTRASTSIVAPLDEWITIGGTAETDNEVITAILEAGARSQNSRLNISLKVMADQ